MYLKIQCRIDFQIKIEMDFEDQNNHFLKSSISGIPPIEYVIHYSMTKKPHYPGSSLLILFY